MRIGVLGGTFDPPHYGHLIIAEQARDQLSLDRLLWVLAGVPPHKNSAEVTPVRHRRAMLELALEEAANPTFALSLVDVERPGPHYSVDMLSILSADFPGAELFFLIGADSLRDLPTWHQPHRLLRHARLAVLRRPGVEYDLQALEALIPGIKDNLVFVAAPLIEIAANDIRARVANGKTIRYLVPEGVARYIQQNRLYQA